MEELKKAFDGLLDEIQRRTAELDARAEVQDLCASAMDDRSKELDMRELDVLKKEREQSVLQMKCKYYQNRTAALERRLAEIMSVL